MPLSADSPLYPAITDIVNAAAGPHPFDAVKAVLSDYTNRFHALGGPPRLRHPWAKQERSSVVETLGSIP